MSEYNKYSKYRLEVERLYNFLITLHDNIMGSKYSDTKLLVPIILGSTMEDALINLHSEPTNIFQFTQLFPNYIGNFIKTFSKEKKHIQIIIISPDNLFELDTYQPLFTLYNNKYILKKNNNFEFELCDTIGLGDEIDCSEFNLSIQINIFNCPFPSVDTRTSIIVKYNRLIQDNNLSPNEYSINSYFQTESDIAFIGNFYQLIGMIFNFNDYKNIHIIVNSYVSFKNLDINTEKYFMFKQLLSICDRNNIIATEWDFVDELMCMKIVSSYHIGNKHYKNTYIEYVTDENLTLNNIDESVIKKNKNLTKLCQIFHIDFSRSDLMERFVFNLDYELSI